MAPKVAVVGLGALGIVSLKNLLEEGFDAVGIERREYLGGLWRFDESENISVMKTTVSNGCKQRGCFTDYPFPDETSDFAPAEEVEKYLVDYARHFGVDKHARLGTNVSQARWDEKRRQWGLSISKVNMAEKAEVEYFDKVVFAMGTDQTPMIPRFPGIDKFKGFQAHSVAFKRPETLAGKKVFVVGFGNTAADMATELSKVASQVYLSHRGGSIVLPRWVKGRPVDHVRTYRKYCMLQLLSRYTPGLWEKTMNSVIGSLQRELYDLKPEWRFSPAPSIANQRPMVTCDLIPALSSGKIISTPGVERIVDANTIETTDGNHYEVDAIIYCTGFSCDFSIVGPDADPTRNTTKEWEMTVGANGRSLPRLYQNIFSLDHPNSLAFMGNLSFMNPAFFMFDLAAMALTQLWKGTSQFPPQAEMERHVDLHHKWVCELATRGSVMPAVVRASDWMDWVNEAAGTGVDENLGYTWQGWKFWFSDRKFCGMCMDGLLSPHAYRLFPGKRKRWDGAKSAIVKMNEDLLERFGPMP